MKKLEIRDVFVSVVIEGEDGQTDLEVLKEAYKALARQIVRYERHYSDGSHR